MTRSALILVIDRLGAGFLGPYGNTWIDTPHFNALAAQSLVLDNMLADSPELPQAYRAYCAGKHSAERDDVAGGAPFACIAAAGVKTSLITDDEHVASLPAIDAFDEKHCLRVDAPLSPAATIEDTSLAKLFAAAVDALQKQRDPFVLWLHARGMQSAWDAPLALRESLAAEDDPPPRQTVEVPALRLPDDYDPDELLGIAQAYAAQVMVLDTCLGALLDASEGHPARDELLTIVTSPRGFPLGEHLIVGDVEPVLYGELLHVPCFLRRGDSQGALLRSGALAQPPDVAATLLDWLHLADADPTGFARSLLPLTENEPTAWPRDRVLCIADGQRAIRTPAWFLRCLQASAAGPTDPASCELFRKPDDRWEANEISRRCPGIVEQLVIAMDQFEQALSAGNAADLAPLTEELVAGIE